jgi:hypothetical protein
MRNGARHAGRVLAIAAAAALVAAALSGSVATAAGPKACKVYNADQEISRDSLQRAVWAADPGDRLIVKGTCVGTTLIAKDLTIGGVRVSSKRLKGGGTRDSGPATIRSGSWRPSIVVDPRVDDFTIRPGLRVLRGIVVGDIGEWKGDAKPVPSAWKNAEVASRSVAASASGLRACNVSNRETGAKFGRSQRAVLVASPGDHLRLRGKCVGETAIDKNLHILGWRISISGKTFGSDKVYRDSSGPPTLTKVAVDDDVDSLVLKALRVTNGFRVGDLAP